METSYTASTCLSLEQTQKKSWTFSSSKYQKEAVYLNLHFNKLNYHSCKWKYFGLFKISFERSKLCFSLIILWKQVSQKAIKIIRKVKYNT